MLADVCAVLDIANPRNAKARLNSEDVNTVRTMDGKRGNPNTTVVNESGLYDVVLDSRKPQARTFRRWITSEVIPALRTTGQNMAQAVERAQLAAQNSGVTCAFTAASNLVARPQGGTVQAEDYLLDRMAAYLVAMNGDPRKPEVAAAQAYFAIQTQRAETAQPAPAPAVDPEALSVAVSAAVSQVLEPMSRVASALAYGRQGAKLPNRG